MATNTVIETADFVDSVRSTTAPRAITKCSTRKAEPLPGTPIITPEGDWEDCWALPVCGPRMRRVKR